MKKRNQVVTMDELRRRAQEQREERERLAAEKAREEMLARLERIARAA